MRALPDRPVFTRSDLRGQGWSDSAVSRAVRGGRLVALRRGRYAAPGPLDPRASAFAAALDCAGSVISHRSALLVHGLPVIGTAPLLPDLTVAPTGTGSAHGSHLHRASLDRCDHTVVDAAPVTTPARTLIDVGRSAPLVTAVAAIDAGLQRRLTSEDELYDVCRRCWNWPGIRRALRAVRLSDGRAESPLESVSRLVIRRLPLPTPDLQTVVHDRGGTFAGRLDFYWDEYGVAGEADGRGKYDTRDVLMLEKERQEHLEDDHLVFVRWGWDQAWARPQLLRARLEAAFERGRARDRSGLPRLWSVRPR